MKCVLILFCLPLFLGVDISHADSDNSRIANIPMIHDDIIPDTGVLVDQLPPSAGFNLPVLLSTLTNVVANPDKMLNVVTLLSHMIYQQSNALMEVENSVNTETANRAAAEDEAVALENTAKQQADAIKQEARNNNIQGDDLTKAQEEARTIIANGRQEAAQKRNEAQKPLNQAIKYNFTYFPLFTEDLGILETVIETLGGNNLKCLKGYSNDKCGHAWRNPIAVSTFEDCLQKLRRTEENSALVKGLFWHTDGNCYAFDMDQFYTCNIAWEQVNFNGDDGWRTCRVEIVDIAAN